MTTRNVTAADFGSRYEAPGAELVRIACQFQSRILLKSGEMQVNAKSIMGMMAFQPSKGMEIEITAEGCDEEQAVFVETLGNLAQVGFLVGIERRAHRDEEQAVLEIEAFLKNE